jgi:hypothetical protein
MCTKEPVVVEIPPETSDVSAFGDLMDAWRRPIADVGPDGIDGGPGGRYLGRWAAGILGGGLNAPIDRPGA